MEGENRNPAQRRYFIRFVITMLLYGPALAVTSIGFHEFHPTGVLVYILALLPALPILAVMVVVGLYLREEKDEFIRTSVLESMLWGIGPTMAVTTVWGSLEKFANVRRLDMFLVYPIYCVFVILAAVVVRRRYR
jgi:hypothetical protein